MNVDYRQIAKVLVSGMPLEGQEYSSKVEEYIKAIETGMHPVRTGLGNKI